MKKRVLFGIVTLMLGLILVGSALAQGEFRLDSATPQGATRGQTVTLTGVGFLDFPPGTNCASLQIGINDPYPPPESILMNACDPGVVWDNDISFPWPDGLKEGYDYNIFLIRVGTFSNAVNYTTGSLKRLFLPLIVK